MKILELFYFNVKNKMLTWKNTNYFFAATFFVLFLNCLVFAIGNLTHSFSGQPSWGTFSVANLFQALLNSYSHSNDQHFLLNMLCFCVVGLYLERKQGSLKFLLLIFVMSVFTAFATSTNFISLNWLGFSGVNYGLYGYIIVEYIFTLCQKDSRHSFNTIHGGIVLALIYFAMCFNGGISHIGFALYPYDLLNNLGHASGFVVGLLFGIYEMLTAIFQKK